MTIAMTKNTYFFKKVFYSEIHSPSSFHRSTIFICAMVSGEHEVS